jgi:hypothetical protein
MAIAQMVVERLPAEIRIVESHDPRSYRINSDKLLATGFRPRKTVANAIDELIACYRAGTLKSEDRCFNLKWMKQTVAFSRPV